MVHAILDRGIIAQQGKGSVTKELGPIAGKRKGTIGGPFSHSVARLIASLRPRPKQEVKHSRPDGAAFSAFLELAVLFVPDEAQLRHASALDLSQHLVNHNIARCSIGLELEFRFDRQP